VIMNTQFTTSRVLRTGLDNSKIDPEVRKKIQQSIGEIMERCIDQRTKEILGVKDPGNWHQKPSLMPRFGCVIIDPRMT